MANKRQIFLTEAFSVRYANTLHCRRQSLFLLPAWGWAKLSDSLPKNTVGKWES